MNYNELFKVAFTMANNDDWENFIHWLNESPFITETEYNDLWEIGCDIHRRFIG